MSNKVDALETLGTAPLPEGVGRDAIHIAVYPAVAGTELYAGQHVAIRPEGAFVVRSDEAVGVVDPFLRETVLPGQRFWVLLEPRTITGLRHVWSHPAFGEE